MLLSICLSSPDFLKFEWHWWVASFCADVPLITYSLSLSCLIILFYLVYSYHFLYFIFLFYFFVINFFILNDGRITRKLFLAPELTYQRLIIICRKTYFVAWSFDVACSCMYIICTLSLKKPCIYDIPSSVVCMAVRGCQAPEVQSSAPGPAA